MRVTSGLKIAWVQWKDSASLVGVSVGSVIEDCHHHPFCPPDYSYIVILQRSFFEILEEA